MPAASWLSISGAAAILLIAFAAPASGVAAQVPDTASHEWPAHGRDALGSRFSPLAQINRDNVNRLTVAWTYNTGEPLPDPGRRRSLEVTPIVLGGVMYISTPLGKVMALDPVSGREKWRFDAGVEAKIRFGDFTNRGVSAWQDRIFLATTDARLIALEAATGTLIRSFGDSGTVNLRLGLRNAPFEFAEYEVTSPPAIIGDLVVIGSAVADNNRTDAATGEVRAYDARSGRLRWSWDPVPQDPADAAHSSLSPHNWDGVTPHPDCQQLVRRLRNEGIFTPPSLEGTLVIPSNIGGAHWGGLAFDPVRQVAVVPVNRLAAMVQLIPASSANLDSLRESRSRIGYEDTRMRGTPYIMRRKILFVPPDIGCTPGAPGALVAIDLKTGTKAWEQPIAPNLGGPIATAGGLVFLAATIDPFIRAFDIDTGREVWKAALPGGGKATPMTYRGADGRQYVVIAAGGDGETWKASDAIVAFVLPRQ